MRATLPLLLLLVMIAPSVAAYTSQETRITLTGYGSPVTDYVAPIYITNATILPGLTDANIRVFSAPSDDPYNSVTNRLDHYTGRIVNGQAAVVYVKFDTFSPTGETIYLYTNKSGEAPVTTESTSIFEHYSGFENASVFPFTTNTGGAATRDTVCTQQAVDDCALRLDKASSTGSAGFHDNAQFVPGTNFVHEFWRKDDCQGSTTATDSTNSEIRVVDEGSLFTRYDCDGDFVVRDGASVATVLTGLADNVWRHYTVFVDTSGTVYGIIVRDENMTIIYQDDNAGTYVVSGNLIFHQIDNGPLTSYYDDVLVRNFAGAFTEVTATIFASSQVTTTECAGFFGDAGVLYNCDKTSYASVIGISETALDAGYGLLLVLAFGILFTALPIANNAPVEAGVFGAGTGFLTATFLGLFPLWVLLLTLTLMGAIMVSSMRSEGGT